MIQAVIHTDFCLQDELCDATDLMIATDMKSKIWTFYSDIAGFYLSESVFTIFSDIL